MNRIVVNWIQQTDDFLALREEWNELLENSQSDTLFLTWEWLYTWWLHLAERRTLAILTLRSGDRLMAIAPMTLKPPEIKSLVPFRVLELLGTGNVGSDYLSVIIRHGSETSMMPAIVKELLRRNYTIELSSTERDSHVMTMTALAMNSQGCHTTRQTQSFSPYIDLSCFTWDSYMTRNNSSNRARFNKKLRKLEKTFAVRFEQTTRENLRAQNLQTLIELHMKRWDTNGGSNAFDSDALCDFHKTFTGIALDKNWLRLFIMWLDDKPAAAVYGFYYNSTFYYYQAGFDPQYSQYSVGYLAIGLSLKVAIEEGAKEYDMLRGEEGYKYVWATGERELVRLNIFMPTTKGRLCKKYLGLRKGAKTMLMNSEAGRIKNRALAST